MLHNSFVCSQFSTPLELDEHLLLSLGPSMLLHFELLAFHGGYCIPYWQSSLIKLPLINPCHLFPSKLALLKPLLVLKLLHSLHVHVVLFLLLHRGHSLDLLNELLILGLLRLIHLQHLCSLQWLLSEEWIHVDWQGCSIKLITAVGHSLHEFGCCLGRIWCNPQHWAHTLPHHKHHNSNSNIINLIYIWLDIS